MVFFFFYKKGRQNRKPRTSATAAKSFHNKLKKREQEKGDRRKRERRQDHSACRATEEAGEEQVISFVQKMKQMLALSENCLHRNDIKPQWWVVKRFHCWVHTEASVRGIESKRHYWELEHWQYNIQFSYTRRSLWPSSSAWLFDRKLQRVSSGPLEDFGGPLCCFRESGLVMSVSDECVQACECVCRVLLKYRTAGCIGRLQVGGRNSRGLSQVSLYNIHIWASAHSFTPTQNSHSV